MRHELWQSIISTSVSPSGNPSLEPSGDPSADPTVDRDLDTQFMSSLSPRFFFNGRGLHEHVANSASTGRTGVCIYHDPRKTSLQWQYELETSPIFSII